MPLYEYICPKHGTFERRAGYEDYSVPCACGRVSKRQAVYVEQGVIFKGGGFTKSVLPPPGSPDVQAEWGKELRKQGWSGDRAVEEIRKNLVTDESGNRHLNLNTMTNTTAKYRVSEFQEASAEVAYHYTKAENAGMPVKRPDLYKAAKREARRRGAKVR